MPWRARPITDHDLEHLVDHLGVKSAGGLVKEHGTRVHGKGAGDGYALLLTAGDLGGHFLGLLGHAHALEQAHGATARLFSRETQHVGGGEHHVFQHGHVREQVELLEDHAQLGAHGSELATFLRQRLAIDKNLTRVDGLQTIDGAAEGRFARTGWANNHDNFAGDD